MRLNAATTTDGYKLSHGSMYPHGTTQVYSNLTPRSDKYYRQICTPFYDGKLVWVGAQGAVYEIADVWNDFFVTEPDVVIPKFARRLAGYLGGFEPAVEALTELHEVGYLPLEFRSLPEGTKVPMGVPVLTVTNTDPRFFWLTNYLETIISTLTWKTATNATIAAEYKAICEHFAALTGVDAFTVSVQCHDFSMRGMSGPEDAARSGFAHLTQFIGTDNLPAMDYADEYYEGHESEILAISVPATEHAVATSNILCNEEDMYAEGCVGENVRLDAEMQFLRELITERFPRGIVSYVTDSYDYWAMLTEIIPLLKDVILSRDASNVAPGKLVIRPDSGDPVKVICGYKVVDREFASEAEFYDVTDGNSAFQYDVRDKEVVKVASEYRCFTMVDPSRYGLGAVIPECEVKGSIQCLWDTFGGTVTDTGYKLLDSHIGLIYGDSINTKRAVAIFEGLAEKGFASGNVVLGVGSHTYQHNTRDTFGFAIKCTAIRVDGELVEVYKAPKTDPGKSSAKGLLFVGRNTEGLFLQDCVSLEDEQSEENNLKLIYKDGSYYNTTSLEDIRNRLK